MGGKRDIWLVRNEASVSNGEVAQEFVLAPCEVDLLATEAND